MTTNAAKVAFSLDSTLLARVERLRRSTGESRSALIARALALLTATEERSARARRYVMAYKEQPETEADISRARKITQKSLAALPWDDA
jgi:metal-responsive CopG/Arc/MetJ family transcriptional regulator